MKKVLLLFIFCGEIVIGQIKPSEPTTNISQSGLSDPEYVKLKSDYAEMTRSEVYIALKANQIDFATKLGSAPSPVLEPQDGWISWISENLTKTGFKSVEEADLMKKKGIELASQNMTKFPKVYEKMRMASPKQRMAIMKAEREGEFK